METIYWRAKLAAYVHDPAEKALVLFREAHEAGTVRELCREIFNTEAIPNELRRHVKKADRWAAAADRLNLPWKPGEPYPEWAKVSFTGSPELVHPVSPGVQIRIRETFKDLEVEQLKAVSFDHFKELVGRDGSAIEMKKTFIRFWRFAPETPAEGLNNLWQVLPADTRSPDHSIWDHLKLCSALAGVFAIGQEPALLVVSLGPVQGFIAQARSTSDLWAGSHLLSQLAWQSMRPLCEEYGPDTILFPDLHGNPAVDQWLVESGLWPEGRRKPWGGARGNMPLDRDPRMAAALPNRFVAVVPAKDVSQIVLGMLDEVRSWVHEQAEKAAKEVFGESLPEAAQAQIKEQLKDFPELYWSLVPWSLVKEKDGKADAGRLFGVISEFLPEGADPTEPAEGTWDILSRPLVSESGKWRFYEPNCGAAYTHIYRLVDRLHGSAKSARQFEGMQQEGYRCTICGEREWLADDRETLISPPGKRGATSWSRAGSIVRKGEHLCALCALKRYWPSVYPKFVAAEGRRYVVSTHTMALATSIERVIDAALEGSLNPEAKDAAKKLAISTEGLDRAAFPRRLWRKLREFEKKDQELFKALTGLPTLLDRVSDMETSEGGEKEAEELDRNRNIRALLESAPETYFALILMDGDKMGAWLSGTEGEYLPPYRDTLHSHTANGLDGEFGDDKDMQEFLNSRRPNTPARHQAISRALNNFSLHLAREVVEEVFTGKLIYAGGDDLLAMVSVQDLPGLMMALRCLYSGVLLDSDEKWQALTGREEKPRLLLRKGYALLGKKEEKRLYAMMGHKATASIGAVIAHHKAPLGRVLRSLRAAERAAKSRGGRDAFCIALEKRSGGKTELVGKWGIDGNKGPEHTTIGALLDLRDTLANEGVSRRAAYVIHDVLRDIPSEREPLTKVITHRLERQGAKDVDELVGTLVGLAMEHGKPPKLYEPHEGRGAVPAANRWLQEVFVTAEFLARPYRFSEGGENE